MKNFWSLIPILTLTLIISGCQSNQTAERNQGGGQTWIDAPLNNTVISLAPYDIIFHGYNPVGINEFEIRINGEVAAVVPAMTAGIEDNVSFTLFYNIHSWTPPSPGEYSIEVRPIDGNGNTGPPTQVTVFITSDDVRAPENGQPTAAPTEELGDCTYTAAVNLFCRTGTGRVYPEIDSFVPGQSALVVGMSEDGLYSYVEGPNFGEVCAVPSDDEFGELTGDCASSPVMTPPPIPPTATYTPLPPPTLTPTPCTSTRGCP